MDVKNIQTIRLDRLLSSSASLSRREAKRAALSGRITVDGVIVKSPDLKIPVSAEVKLDGKALLYSEFVYLMMNKPAGFVCSNDEPSGTVVFELLAPEYAKRGLFTVGRLDKHTTGLLLITDDGALTHNLISPKKLVAKKYFLRCEAVLTERDAEAFAAGVDIGEKRPTAPAKLEILEEGKSAFLTITEGKFHQVKRMLASRGNKVTELERVTFGPLSLDQNLARGEYRLLSAEELELLKDTPETGKTGDEI